MTAVVCFYSFAETRAPAGAVHAPMAWDHKCDCTRNWPTPWHALPVIHWVLAAFFSEQNATAFTGYHFLKDLFMTLNLSIGPLVSLIAGILILVMPRLLSTIVAVYLIIMGVIGLLGLHALRF